ncbi:MAG: methylmalonyl-CoA mutase family protein [Terracidiphilus sp.]
MAAHNFLSEFPPVSTERWESLIRENLKGSDYASKLTWHPEEGLAVRPYYRADDLAGLRCPDSAPGEFPFVRGTRPGGGWRIREKIDSSDPEEANRAACAAVKAGAEGIAFSGSTIKNSSDLALLLANLNEIPICLEGLGKDAARTLNERLQKRPHGAGVSADIDPLADLDFSAELIRDRSPGFRPFVIHADAFHERAAGAIEEVGFALSAAVDFVVEMQERGLNVDHIAGSVSFSFAMGPEFFIQIAKLRAFRMAWAKAMESFGETYAAGRAQIHANTARWNETIYDAHVNILRVTTEVISAILGGADSISAAPFDECYRQPDESSRRLARNTQIVLKQEALLSRVADPLGGAYLVEALTSSIASKAWKSFQELETAGGYRKAIEADVIASVLERRTSLREQAAASRRRVFTGTNRFADASERVLDRTDAARVNSGSRAAQAFEHLRLRTERFERRTGRQPRIVLAEIGDPRMRSARSQFSADFLACAGLASHKQQFESAGQIAGCDADLIVLCSADAEYPAIARELLPLLRDRGRAATVVIAGNPDSTEDLRNLGITEFIHLRSNAVEVLSRLQQQIGIGE